MAQIVDRTRIERRFADVRLTEQKLAKLMHKAMCPVLLVSYDHHHRQILKSVTSMIVYRNESLGYYVFVGVRRAKVTLIKGRQPFVLVLKGTEPWVDYEGDFNMETEIST